jgi:Lactate racemase N-terminal domain
MTVHRSRSCVVWRSTVDIHFPDDWNVIAHWPPTPRPLDDDVLQALRRPCGQLPIRELAHGWSRPVIIVDDCTRPTPAARVLPQLLEELQAAGIPANAVGIVVAQEPTVPRRLGAAAETGRRRLVALPGSPAPRPNRGSSTSVVTPAVPRCCSINLHYGNSSERGSYNIDNDFGRELEEIADMLRLETSVCLHVDAIGRPYASPRETTARFTVTRSPSPKDSTAPLHPRCRPGGERLSHGSVVDFPAEQSSHTAVTTGSAEASVPASARASTPGS